MVETVVREVEVKLHPMVHSYGLRHAQRLIREQRKAIASTARYSRSLYVTGMRDALKDLDWRISAVLKEMKSNEP
jgi:hypothetical protein